MWQRPAGVQRWHYYYGAPPSAGGAFDQIIIMPTQLLHGMLEYTSSAYKQCMRTSQPGLGGVNDRGAWLTRAGLKDGSRARLVKFGEHEATLTRWVSLMA